MKIEISITGINFVHFQRRRINSQEQCIESSESNAIRLKGGKLAVSSGCIVFYVEGQNGVLVGTMMQGNDLVTGCRQRKVGSSVTG